MKIQLKSMVHNITLDEKKETITKAIMLDDIINYNEDDVKVSLNFKERILKRRSKESEIILDFNNKKGTYNIFGYGIIEIKLKTNKFTKTYIDYEINIDNNINHVIYTLEYEVIK